MSDTRFRPHRLGIVGLYEYGEQEFRAEEGRLALRGRNTSGKSKALELLIPFVLDGDITPRKLDPFASSAKTMRWNLIECTDAHPDRRANKRVGYVWAEFRAVEGEQERFLTCGIGLEATRHTDGVKDRWYFTTPQRVGSEVLLTRMTEQGAQPVLRRDLAGQLEAGGGALHDGPVAYKQALRAELIGFATDEQYEQMLELIRLLRKPKLSESLNVARLSQMLSRALPAVDDALVRKLGDALEQLHELQRQHEDLERARGMVASIVERSYRSYARGVLAQRAEGLRQAESGFQAARTRARATAEALDAAVQVLEEAERTAARLEHDGAGATAEYEQLIGSSAYEAVGLIDDRARQRDEAADRERRARTAAEAATQRSTDAQAAAAAAREGADRAGERVRAVAAELDVALVDAGLPAAGDETAALRAVPGRITARRAHLEATRTLVEAARRARQRVEDLADGLADAEREAARAAATLDEMTAQREQALDDFDEQLGAWRDALREFRIDDAALEALADEVTAGAPVGDAVSRLARSRLDELTRERARLEARRDTAQEERDTAAERVRELEVQTYPAPAPRSPRPPDREGRPGAPLWALCDFDERLPEDDRAGLEAALEEAGLLDAWVSPDGEVHDADLSLVADAGAEGPTLADLLVADPGDSGVAAQTVTAVLRSIALDGPLSAAPGRFRFGALHGRATKPAAQFIGAAARAEHRARLLADARRALAACEEAITALDLAERQVRAAQARVAEDCAAAPATDALRSAREAERRAGETVRAAERHLATLIAQRERLDADAVQASDRSSEHLREHRLPAGADGLTVVGQALERAGALQGSVLAAVQDAAAANDRATTAVASASAAAESAGQAAVDLRTAEGQLAEAEGRLQAVTSALGQDADEVRARAAALRERRDELVAAARDAQAALRTAISECKDAERAASDAEAEVGRAEAARVSALDGFRRLGRHDLFTAALGTDAAPTDERAAEQWVLTTALERLRALPALDVPVRVEDRVRRVNDAVSELQRNLTAFEMDANVLAVDGLTLVEITREGRRVSPTAMLTELDGDLQHREQILSAKRREVLGNALLGEIAEHLRQRIVTVRASIRSRNEMLRRCPTGAGRTVSLTWEPDEDAGAPREILRLLGERSVANLPPADQDTLRSFVLGRIADARSGADEAGADTAIVDHLTAALDYRRWWRFGLQLHEPDGSQRRLTAKAHGLGSGGEQSVLMHLPLFATAAALYELAPGAPRIVALDEAMDGIDPMTREQVFALLVELDLDWVMTSYDLNPCVATVPRVGFYELHRENAEWGVWAQHFIWDGVRTTEVVGG